MKKLIIAADDFGIDEGTNVAIMECIRFGLVTETSILANGAAYKSAIEKAKNSETPLNIGIHLNITQGRSITTTKKGPLTDKKGNYNNSFLSLLLKSQDESFLAEVKKEFRAQIEKILKEDIKPTCINSHGHIHAIPPIFKIVCQLAKEFEIPRVRTQNELIYFTEDINKRLNDNILMNTVKSLFFTSLTYFNKQTAKKCRVATNNFYMGILYAGNIDKTVITKGIKTLPDNTETEIILHPTINQGKTGSYKEYVTLTDEKLRNALTYNNSIKGIMNYIDNKL